jgi:SET domain-containing protein
MSRGISMQAAVPTAIQVITAGGNKRMVLYAKRDIRRGVEICYDYKINLEEDQCKRFHVTVVQ